MTTSVPLLLRSPASVCVTILGLLLSGCDPGTDEPRLDESDPISAAPESYDELGDQRVTEQAGSLLGAKVPAVSLSMLDGSRVELADLLGEKPLYLKFWATWCIPCRGQMSHFESVYQRFGSELNVIGINVGLNDDRTAVRAFQEEYGLTMAMAHDADGSVSRAFRLVVTPQHVVIDSSGIIRFVGHSAGDALDLALEEVVGNVPDADHESAETVVQRAALPRVHDVAEDDSALDLALIDGTTFDLESSRGRPIVLSFTATWCDWYLADTRPEVSAACAEQQRSIERAHRRFGSAVHFAVIAQSLWTDRTQVESYRDRHAIETPLGLDETGAWFSKFSVRNIPTTLLLDADGNEVVRLTGPADELGEILGDQL